MTNNKIVNNNLEVIGTLDIRTEEFSQHLMEGPVSVEKAIELLSPNISKNVLNKQPIGSACALF